MYSLVDNRLVVNILMVYIVCDLPGRVGGGKVHSIALQKCWPDYLVQHSAKTGPLTVSCQQSTYLNKDKLKQGTTGTGKVHIRA